MFGYFEGPRRPYPRECIQLSGGYPLCDVVVDHSEDSRILQNRHAHGWRHGGRGDRTNQRMSESVSEPSGGKATTIRRCNSSFRPPALPKARPPPPAPPATRAPPTPPPLHPSPPPPLPPPTTHHHHHHHHPHHHHHVCASCVDVCECVDAYVYVCVVGVCVVDCGFGGVVSGWVLGNG